MNTKYCFFLFMLAFPILLNSQSAILSIKDLKSEIIKGKPTIYKFEDKRFTGMARDHYPEEGLTLEYHIEDGLITRQLGWKDSGVKERDYQYRKGVLNGTVIGYYDNGQKYFEEIYIDGLHHGIQYSWYSDGSLRTKSEQVNGFEIMRFEFTAPAGVLDPPKTLRPGC